MKQDLLVLGQWNRHEFGDFVRFWSMKILILLLRLYAFCRTSTISFCIPSPNYVTKTILKIIWICGYCRQLFIGISVSDNESRGDTKNLSHNARKGRNNAFPSFSNIKFYQTEYHSPGTWAGFVVNCISIIHIAFPIQLSGEWFVIKLTQEMQREADI